MSENDSDIQAHFGPVVYKVRIERLPELQERVAKLARRAIKLSAAPEHVPGIVVVTHENVVITNEDTGVKTVRVYAYLAVQGSAPKIAGFEFVATLEHIAPGANIVHRIGAEELSVEFRTVEPRCEHCKLSRRRADTYVLRGAKGLIQVGKSCLKDFTGHASPENIVSIATLFESLLDELGGEGSDDGLCGGGGGSEHRFEFTQFLGLVVMSIREGGWVSRGAARASQDNDINDYSDKPSRTATADDVWNRLTNNRMPESSRFVDGEAAAKAVVVMDWAKTLQVTDPSEYIGSLAAVVLKGYVDHRSSGLAASIVAAFDRETTKRLERAARPVSAHFGTIGKREVFTLTCFHIASFESDFGVCFIYMMRDAAGNCAKWKTNNGEVMERGETYSVKGTVKAHSEYKGTLQTELSRCAATKIAPVVTPAHATAGA